MLFKPTIRVTWWKTIRNLSDLGIIVSVLTLFVILLVVVFGLTDLGGPAGIIILAACLLLLISLGMDWAYQYYSEVIRESEQKDEKQSLFKPTIGVSVMFIFFIAMPLFLIFSQFTENKAEFGLFISGIGLLVFFTWIWNTVPVFIFAEDSVQIKSHLFYLLGIDRKTAIRFADITSVRNDPNVEGGMWGGHLMVISMNGTILRFSLFGLDEDAIAKIYLRFKEKLGDKVKLE